MGENPFSVTDNVTVTAGRNAVIANAGINPAFSNDVIFLSIFFVTANANKQIP
jgi:hypothetical protein